MSLQPAAHDVLQDKPALQRPLAEMGLERSPEQPLRSAQACVIFEVEVPQRQQVAARVEVFARVSKLRTAKPLLELVDVARVCAQRLAGRRLAVELEPVAERAEQLELEFAQHAGGA